MSLRMKNKIAILGDTHFGARNDSVDFINYFEKFYTNVFFPQIRERGIKTIIQLGDLFDRRKFINFNSLYRARDYFFDKIEEYDLELITLLGNHDISYKNTLEVNSPFLLLDSYNNIEIFKEFGRVDVNGIDIDIIPWICEENSADILTKIKQSRSQVCVGHFEINGFEMDRGNVFKGGHMDKKDLLKYDMVLSGHFHHKSDDKHIFYLGRPYEITWSDWNDPRGFHIFDVSTRELEFIENPYKMFHKIVYDDSKLDSKYWKGFDFDSMKETYVKIVVTEKKDLLLFDDVVDKLYKSGVHDIGIVEDFTDKEEKHDDDVDQAEDTLNILYKHIDTQEYSVDSEKLKNVMREVYIEALNVGKSE